MNSRTRKKNTITTIRQIATHLQLQKNIKSFIKKVTFKSGVHPLDLLIVFKGMFFYYS